MLYSSDHFPTILRTRQESIGIDIAVETKLTSRSPLQLLHPSSRLKLAHNAPIQTPLASRGPETASQFHARAIETRLALGLPWLAPVVGAAARVPVAEVSCNQSILIN